MLFLHILNFYFYPFVKSMLCDLQFTLQLDRCVYPVEKI